MKRPATHRPHLLEPSEEDVRRCAYFLWQEEGRPTGRDLELWLTAKELARHHVPERPARAAPKRKLSA